MRFMAESKQNKGFQTPQGIKVIAARPSTWYAVIGLIVFIVIIYFVVKLSKKGKTLDLPQGGTNIPAGWDANNDARALYAAMKSEWYNPFSWGTDNSALFAVIENKTPDQLALIYNAFTSLYNEDLFQWFQDDLSSAEYTRAMEIFRPVTAASAGNSATPSKFQLFGGGKNMRQTLIVLGIFAVLIFAIYVYLKTKQPTKTAAK